jgi:2-polyprenyl-6-methoxyphenol hydroxylase-like FAD-dependent oxidoreductase
MKAIVVGGGIAGLASALALIGRGWSVEVIEQAPEFTEVGAGLSLWPNALRALDALGVGDEVRGMAALEGHAGIQDSAGRWLSRTDAAELDRRYGPSAMIHRADLLAVLRAAVPDAALRPATTVTAVSSAGTLQYAGETAAGETAVADLIVGADGLRSLTRTSLWPDSPAPRYAGYTVWRLVTPPLPITETVESWGRGERFGYVPLADGRVYCYATANAPEGSSDSDLAGLRGRFGRWHDPIPALLDAADPAAVLHHDLYELPPLKSYTCDRVVLVGDAAHAMTPDLGQGACQALEDAVVLAEVMANGYGLSGYDRLRLRRTQMIARRSRWSGAVAQWASPAAATVRDFALRLAPRHSFVRSLAPVLDWTAPAREHP